MRSAAACLLAAVDGLQQVGEEVTAQGSVVVVTVGLATTPGFGLSGPVRHQAASWRPTTSGSRFLISAAMEAARTDGSLVAWTSIDDLAARVDGLIDGVCLQRRRRDPPPSRGCGSSR